MATVGELALPREVAARSAEEASAAEQVSQWTLMWWRFLQNRLSVAGGIGLIGMYLVAAFADFLAPYPAGLLDTEHSFASPTKIVLAGARPAVCPLSQTLDEHTFNWVYEPDCDLARPIELFARGHEYRLFGLIKTDRHLFGVTTGAPVVGAAKQPASQPAAAPAARADDPLAAFMREQRAAAAAGVPGASQGGAPVVRASGEKAPKLYLLGADSQGRDLLSRLLEGSRISLTIGLAGVALGIVIGSLMGTASGYRGGTVDNIIQRMVEIIQAIPKLPLWAAFAAALPRTMPVVQRYFLISIILSLVDWPGLARQLRGKVMAYRTLDYVAAARLAGSGHLRIILTHMLPNAASHIIVVATFAVPGAILGETALSFLGLGMLPPAVSWGVLLKDAQQIDSVLLRPWLLIPAIPVILTVTCYQLLGDGLRDAADPYS